MDRLRAETVRESAVVRYEPPEARDAEVASLRRPWIGDEGPCDAHFRHRDTSEPGEPLRRRGVAFDGETTVVWDEDAVQVVRAGPREPDVVALRSPVLVREGFPESKRVTLWRVDYLRRGALLASRYVPAEDRSEERHA